jgi:nucleoside-diphosphate-sugar epimerase
MGLHLKKVLLTGSNGFLGGRLKSELYKYKIDLILTTGSKKPDSMKCNLLLKDEVVDLINNSNPDLVIHCAAFVPKTLEEYESNELSFKNKIMLENILNTTSVPIVYISSMTVYGSSDSLIRREIYAGNPESMYGKSKYECELLLKKDGRESIAARIPGLFGSFRHNGLVYNTMKSFCNNEYPDLLQKEILWAAMDVKDAAKVIAELSINNKFNSYTPINIGYAETYSINRFLRICEELFNKKIKYNIVHPDFKFELSIIKELGILPTTYTLKNALIKLKDQYEH